MSLEAYHDIVSWAESAYPSSQYESFSEWSKEIIADFNKSGHYLPEGIIAELQESWLREYGVLDKDSADLFYGDDELSTEAEEQQQDAVRKQIEDLPSKEEYQGDVSLRRHIREQKRYHGLSKKKSKGKRSRKRKSSSR